MLSSIKDFLWYYLRFFWDLFIWLMDWILDGSLALFSFVFFSVLDGLCALIFSLVDAIDFSEVVFSSAAAWADVPGQIIWFVSELGLPQCFSMVGVGLGIRVLLNLLPASITRV